MLPEVVLETTTEVDAAAQQVIDTWTKRMQTQTEAYVKREIDYARRKAEKTTGNGSGVEEQEAEPVVGTYPWWNILIAGPFQPTGAGGPFLPHKIFQPTQPAFLVGALWLNPAPINWFPPAGPSAATVMGAFEMTINFHTINLSTVAAGPAIPPVVMSPLGAAPGLPWFKPFVVSLGPGLFPVPPNGDPALYELNVTADVSGPVPQPFAGYSTWVLDPDMEPAIWPPSFVRPPVFPHWQYDIPVRFLVYQA